jgi:hypothetical protein
VKNEQAGACSAARDMIVHAQAAGDLVPAEGAGRFARDVPLVDAAHGHNRENYIKLRLLQMLANLVS